MLGGVSRLCLCNKVFLLSLELDLSAVTLYYVPIELYKDRKRREVITA